MGTGAVQQRTLLRSATMTSSPLAQVTELQAESLGGFLGEYRVVCARVDGAGELDLGSTLGLDEHVQGRHFVGVERKLQRSTVSVC